MCAPLALRDRPSPGSSTGAGTVTTGGAAHVFPAPHRAARRVTRAAASEGCRAPPGPQAADDAWHRDRVHCPLVAAVVTLSLLALVCGVVVAVTGPPAGPRHPGGRRPREPLRDRSPSRWSPRSTCCRDAAAGTGHLHRLPARHRRRAPARGRVVPGGAHPMERRRRRRRRIHRRDHDGPARPAGQGDRCLRS